MELIDWTCDTCHGKTEGKGAISIAYDEIHRANDILKTLDATRLTVADAVAQPNLALWKVECDTCAGECIGAYWIDLRKLRDDADIVEWTRHLERKTWFAATNWDALVASAPRVKPLRVV
ncbi:hypothetical protein [Paractinoplanes maris]|uniref:hypothetical protein n=1 Tax=Paractinoplanes maris TaxID=1734446 RepID=UPI00201FDDE5|nr:hypothetical protein [Actinoplanes maris]